MTLGTPMTKILVRDSTSLTPRNRLYCQRLRLCHVIPHPFAMFRPVLPHQPHLFAKCYPCPPSCLIHRRIVRLHRTSKCCLAILTKTPNTLTIFPMATLATPTTQILVKNSTSPTLRECSRGQHTRWRLVILRSCRRCLFATFRSLFPHRPRLFTTCRLLFPRQSHLFAMCYLLRLSLRRYSSVVVAMVFPSPPLPLHSMAPSRDLILPPTFSCPYNLRANQVRPVATTLAREFRIARYNHRDHLTALGTDRPSPEVFELVREEWRPGDRESSSSLHHSHQLCVSKKGSTSLHLGYYFERSRVSLTQLSATAPYSDAVSEYRTSSSTHRAFDLCINLVILLGILRLLVLAQGETSTTTVLEGGFTYATRHEIPLYALALYGRHPYRAGTGSSLRSYG